MNVNKFKRNPHKIARNSLKFVWNVPKNVQKPVKNVWNISKNVRNLLKFNRNQIVGNATVRKCKLLRLIFTHSLTVVFPPLFLT